jgi:hypothetical protein
MAIAYPNPVRLEVANLSWNHLFTDWYTPVRITSFRYPIDGDEHRALKIQKKKPQDGHGIGSPKQ